MSLWPSSCLWQALLGLMFCCCHLKILKNFTFYFVFCTSSLMRQWSIHMDRADTHSKWSAGSLPLAPCPMSTEYQLCLEFGMALEWPKGSTWEVWYCLQLSKQEISIWTRSCFECRSKGVLLHMNNQGTLCSISCVTFMYCCSSIYNGI